MLGAGASPSPRQPEVPTEQQHIHYSAAFQPLSITRLLSQSRPGAFESGMTRLPFLQPPRLVLRFLKPQGEQLSSHNKHKLSALKGTRSFSSSSPLFCSTGYHHLLPHLLLCNTCNLSARPRRTLSAFHVSYSLLLFFTPPQQILHLFSILDKCCDNDNQQKSPVLQKVPPGAGGAAQSESGLKHRKRLQKWL